MKSSNLVSGLTVALFTVILGGVWGLHAQTAPAKEPLQLVLTAQKVIKAENGQEALEKADKAKPGETIQYQVNCANASDRKLGNIKPSLPIPQGTLLVPDSAQPAPTEASLDGKEFRPVPLKRKVTLPDGKEEERLVPQTEYRAVRWHVGELAPAQSTNLTARVRLTAAAGTLDLTKNLPADQKQPAKP